ncbi:MAG: response regulator [Bacteroidetes bacterium]|nr:MAG: response regulator [Bacteroidota bacterium]
MTKPDYTLIFVVEDDQSYAKVISHSLENKNFMNVKIFSSGEECLEHMWMNPEVILLDYRLGEGKKDGMEVLKAIRKQNEEVQIVFLTSVDQLEVATNTIKAGAYDYVVKSEGAMERIRNILRRIKFENHIKKENRLLKRSRKVIMGVIFVLIVFVLFLGLLQILR